jgi:ABC-type nickel/cobalt efflux system permease component RcnA
MKKTILLASVAVIMAGCSAEVISAGKSYTKEALLVHDQSTWFVYILLIVIMITLWAIHSKLARIANAIDKKPETTLKNNETEREDLFLKSVQGEEVNRCKTCNKPIEWGEWYCTEHKK